MGVFNNLDGTTEEEFSLGVRPPGRVRVVGVSAFGKKEVHENASGNNGGNLTNYFTWTTPTLKPGWYKVGISVITRLTSASRDFIGAVLFDNNEIIRWQVEHKDPQANQRVPYTLFDYIEVTTENAYDLEFRYGSDRNSVTAHVFKCVFDIDRRR